MRLSERKPAPEAADIDELTGSVEVMGICKQDESDGRDALVDTVVEKGSEGNENGRATMIF